MEKQTYISGISACLIVKDEQETLEKCLISIKPWVDEICIVDTGSSDNTLDIAAKYNARIKHYTWNESFSKARNFSLEMARYSWIFIIDADERLVEEHGHIIKRIIEKDEAQAYMVFQDNKMPSGEVQSIAIPRLFRNRPEIRYTRDIHESIMENLIHFGLGNPESSDIHLNHIGYLPDQVERHNKNQRNKKILRNELSTYGDNLFTLYKLAQTLNDNSEREERKKILERAIRIADRLNAQDKIQYPFIGILYSNYADSLIIDGKLTEAVSIIKKNNSEILPLPEIVWHYADLAFRVGDLGLAMNEFQRCLNLHKPDPRIPSDPRFRNIAARSRLGDIALELGDTNSFFQIVGEVVGSDPYITNCRIQRVRALLLSGESQQAFAEIQILSDEFEDKADLQLLKGQIALSQNRRSDADNFLLQASDDSDAGQKARALRILMALQNEDLQKSRSLVNEMVSREGDTAAMVLLVNVILSIDVEIDRAFLNRFLLKKVSYWLGELSEYGNQSILRNFIKNSREYSRQYPGIESLLLQQ